MSISYEFVGTGIRAEEVAKLLLDNKSITLDTETTGLDPHKDQVTLLSITSRTQGTFVIDTRDKKMLEPFGAVFEKDDLIKIMHNGSFDYQLLKGTSGYENENIICTLLGERTLTAGLQWDGYGLDDVTKKYLGKERDKTLQKSFIGHTGPFTAAQLMYAAEDSADLFGIADAMHASAKEKGLLKTWQIESGALQSFADMEYYGQKIDEAAWRQVMAENLNTAGIAKSELDRFFAPVCQQMWDDDGNIVVDMNYESQPDVLSALQMLGVSADGQIIKDTSKKTQKKIQNHPIIKALTKYRTAMKGHSGFGEQYVSAIHPITGRVHFRFNQYGTDTGRPACRGGLNCLNIPREKRYRDSFTTDPDRLLGTVDYSGAELRIMSDLSGDPLMVKGFNSGEDFHCFVAALLFNKEKVGKKDPLRTPTKEINFGLAYGMGPNSLYEKLNAAGYKISLEDCKKLFWKYMETFEVTVRWLKSQQKLASTKFQMTNINGRVRNWNEPNFHKIRAKIVEELESKKNFSSYSDIQIDELAYEKRKGQLAAIEREGANFGIQSVNADFTKVAMHRCRKEFKKRGFGPNTAKGARTYNSVYDEIVYDFHKDNAEEGFSLQKEIMVKAANEMLRRVPMEVEGHLDTKWVK